MSEPLSRELCERLAQMYPEARDHVFEPGDLYYRGTIPEVLVVRRDSWRAGEDVWTPRLEDLLQLAAAQSKRSVQLEEWLPDDVPELELAWAFGECGYEDIIEAAYGATPVEAVARWLLARKECQPRAREEGKE